MKEYELLTDNKTNQFTEKRDHSSLVNSIGKDPQELKKILDFVSFSESNEENNGFDYSFHVYE